MGAAVGGATWGAGHRLAPPVPVPGPGPGLHAATTAFAWACAYSDSNAGVPGAIINTSHDVPGFDTLAAALFTHIITASK